jgi:O-antigen ligase
LIRINKKTLLNSPGPVLIACLSIYFAFSVTNMPPLLVLCPLLFSGLFLLTGALPVSESGGKNADLSALYVIGLFIFTYVLSVIFSSDLTRSVNAMAVLFPGMLIAYVLCQVPTASIYYLSWGLSVLVLSSSCVTICLFLFSGSTNPSLVLQAYRAPSLVVPNDMLVGVVFLPFAIDTVFYEKRPIPRVLAFGAILALITAVLIVGSRACMLSFFFLLIIYLFLSFRKQFLVSLTIGLLLIYLADFFFKLGIVENFLLLRHENARLSVWLAGLAHWSDHPLLGLGPSNFEVAYRQGISILRLPDWIMIDDRSVPWAHNLYIEALVERGIVGLITLLMLLGLIGSRIYSHMSVSTGRLARFYYAVFASFSGFLFAGLFELTLQRIWVANALFIFLGIAIAPHESTKGIRE